jgi:hypothetical protein
MRVVIADDSVLLREGLARPDGFGYLLTVHNRNIRLVSADGLTKFVGVRGLRDDIESSLREHAEIDDFLDAVRRVGKGGTAIDPEVIGQLLGRRRKKDPLGELTPRTGGAGAHGRGSLQPRNLREALSQPEDDR